MIFHKNVHPTTVPESDSESVSESELFFRIRIQPKNSDYFGFGFGSTTLATVTDLFYCFRAELEQEKAARMQVLHD
jgi:hypothetical protein